MMQQRAAVLWKAERDDHGLDKKEILNRTDRYFQEMEESYERWEKLLQVYESRINRMLKKKVSAAEIIKVVNEDDFQTCCKVEYLFYGFSIACQIGRIEEESSLPSNLGGCGGMDEVCRRMQALIFGLRRIEFNWEEAELHTFLTQLTEWPVTYVMLGELIYQPCITDKINTAVRLAYILEKGQRHREVILLLFYIAKRLEYEGDAVMVFANALLEMGDFNWGYEMLRKYPNPGKEIMELQNMLAERLQK